MLIVGASLANPPAVGDEADKASVARADDRLAGVDLRNRQHIGCLAPAGIPAGAALAEILARQHQRMISHDDINKFAVASPCWAWPFS